MPIDVSYDVTCQTSSEYFGNDCDYQTCNRGIDGQFTAEALNTTIFTATNLAPFVNYTCKGPFIFYEVGGLVEFFEVSLEICMTPPVTKFFPTTPPPIKVIFYVTPLFPYFF